MPNTKGAIMKSLSALFVFFVAISCFGCESKEMAKARELQLQEEIRKAKQAEVQEFEKIRKAPFMILGYRISREKGTGEITVQWESNRNKPLKLDVLDRDGEGLTYKTEPVCKENGHCFYEVTFHVGFGRDVYLTFYDPRGKVVCEESMHVPRLETMILTDEIF